MKSFKTRVNNLLKKTTNTAIREQANTVISMLESGADPNTLSSVLIEQIRSSKPTLGSPESNFIVSEAKIAKLSDLGLNKIFETLSNDSEALKSNPQVPYILSQLKSVFETKTQSVLNVANSLADVLSKFTFLPVFENELKKLTQNINENKEDLLVLSLSETLTRYNNGLYYDLVESLNDYVYDRELISKSDLVKKAKPFEYEPVVKNFIVEFSKFGPKDGLTIISENENFNVHPIHSFIRVDESNTSRITFAVAGNYYEKIRNSLVKLNESQVALLPGVFKRINTYLTKPNVLINESGLSLFVGKNKIRIDSVDGVKQMFLNENAVMFADPYQFLMQSGSFQYNEADELNTVKDIYENFETLVNLDFGKVIVSAINEGFGTVVFKLDDKVDDPKFYVNTINQFMQVNEFNSDINALQVRNKILEFMNYDISESLYEFMDNTFNKIGSLKEAQKLISQEISTLNEQIIKVERAEADPLIYQEIAELHLKEAIQAEISTLKSEWNLYEAQINKLKKISESEEVFEDTGKPDTSKLIPNKQVRVKNSGVIGKIASVNTVTKEISVITDEGDTINCPFDQVELIEDTIFKNAEEMQVKAKEVADAVVTENNDTVVVDNTKSFLGYKKKVVNESRLNESVTPKGSDEFTGYGVEGDKRAKGNERSELEGVKDPNQKFIHDDKKVLMEIADKVTRSIDALGEIEKFLDEYTKLNKKPISSAVNQLKAYHEAIIGETNKL